MSKEEHEVKARIAKPEYELIEKLIKSGLYRSEEDFIKEAVESHISRKASLLDVPQETLKVVHNFYLKNPGSHYYSEVSDALGIDIGIVINTIEILRRENLLEEAKREDDILDLGISLSPLIPLSSFYEQKI